MGNAVRHRRWAVGAIPPELTPPTASSRGTEKCGRSTAWEAFPRPLTPLYRLRRWLLPVCTGRVDFGPARELTFARPEPYITANSARRGLGATARLRSSSLIFGDQASDPNRRPEASTALRASRRVGTALVPGCLTGESEERETWTAESLRAASRSEQHVFEWERPDETSAVDVSGQHFVARSGAGCDANRTQTKARRQEWDLVKRCDRPGKVLIQLESLILAQSERWRQA